MRVVSFPPEGEEFLEFLEFPGNLFPDRKSREDFPVSLIDKCFAVKGDDKILGRMAVYKNNGLKYKSFSARAAGNFHCVDDQDVAEFLFNAASEYAKSSGADYIIGPLNGNTWHYYRFIENVTSPLFFTETWNPEYYPQLWKQSGFTRCSVYHSNIDHDPGAFSADTEAAIIRFKSNGVSFRNIDLSDFENECRNIHLLSERAFSGNAFFTTEKFDSFYEKYRSVLPFMDPDLIIIANDKDGKTIGFSFGISDILNPELKRVVLKTVAREPGESFSGLGNVLIYILRKKAAEKGFNSVIHAFFHDEGATAKLTRDYSGERLRTYVLFARKC